MANAAASEFGSSASTRLYTKTSGLDVAGLASILVLVTSGSVAATASPMFSPVGVFSAISRVVSVVGGNVGASLTFVMVIVTVMVSMRFPLSVAVTMTVWEVVLS